MKISVQPNKLLLSKWTAVQVVAKQKHFIVSKVILPEPGAPSDALPEMVEIEAVYSKTASKAVRQIPWRELQDERLWKRGWH
ncbi:TIGR02450 family Trp-rich protein [Undibacterium sp. FT147W]|uniref:TIGR02450 family Trp-rich protein n=2 Tax=Undibacterium rivi TaxID=2828729 RepID=A0ABS5GZ61_9BURK|nr:TIGR02450 family Trp-rich protein [Undibacterium rivi]